METQDPVVKGTEQALFLLTQKRSEAVFNELLEYATEVCLKKPPTYLAEHEHSQYVATTSEERITQQLGARSLATLLEMKAGVHGLRGEEESFHVSETITEPLAFSDRPNFRILENAERFGQTLIDESFAVLGKDAPLWVEKLKNATTQSEEFAVLTWLDMRIASISEKSRAERSREDESAHFYPPHRISPKFIGAYPQVNIQPSCLAASIAATSFFERAGKPVLHGGVTAPGNEAGSELLLHTLRIFADESERSGSQGRSNGLQRLAPVMEKVVDWLQRPLAQHAAVYTKLSSGWIQFDAYYDASIAMFDEENRHLDSLYETLSSWHATMPNLEFTTSTLPSKSGHLSTPPEAPLAIVLSEYEYPEPTELTEIIATALETIPHESYQSYLFETCLAPLLDAQYNRIVGVDSTYKPILQKVLQSASEKKHPNDTYDSQLRRAFELALHTFVRWENTPEEFIERCVTDPAYRMRRAEDFLDLPHVMATFAAQRVAQTDKGQGHLSIDVGTPAMRIGLATLSDFARYDKQPLPASFWVTHWPGAVSLIENLDNPPASDSDWRLIYNGLLSKLTHPFTGVHNYDKITSFLSTYGKQENNGEEERNEDSREG